MLNAGRAERGWNHERFVATLSSLGGRKGFLLGSSTFVLIILNIFVERSRHHAASPVAQHSKRTAVPPAHHRRRHPTRLASQWGGVRCLRGSCAETRSETVIPMMARRRRDGSVAPLSRWPAAVSELGGACRSALEAELGAVSGALACDPDSAALLLDGVIRRIAAEWFLSRGLCGSSGRAAAGAAGR